MIIVEHLKNALIHCISYFSTPIFLFHSTAEYLPKNLQSKLHNVEPEKFSNMMIWIKKRYDIVPIDELLLSKSAKKKAAVTFDDAYLSVLEEAIPILIDLKIPSTIFINGCNLENSIFWRDKIRYIINNHLVSEFINYIETNDSNRIELNKEYFYKETKDPIVNSKLLDNQLDEFFKILKIRSNAEIPNYCIYNSQQIYKHPLVSYGNHTYHHYVLSSLTKEEQWTEIVENKRIINKLSNNISDIFSIPFGGFKHINNQTLHILKEEQYKGILFSNNIVNINMKENHFNLKIGDRLMVPNSEKQFRKEMVKGFIRPLLRDYNYE